MSDKRVQQMLNIMHKISRMSHMKDVFSDVTKAEFFTMNIIYDFSRTHNDEKIYGITVTHIAKFLDMTAAAMSKMLRLIEEKGYVERRLDDKDRRAVYICLTQKGEKLIREERNRVNARISKIIEILGNEDTNELLRLLNKLADAMQTTKKDYREA